MLTAGTKAPGFTLQGTEGKFSLEEQRGKHHVLLIFYPKDNTPGWIRQLSAARDAASEYAARETVVIGVNTGSMASHQKFEGLYHFGFPILVDEGKQVATAFGALKENGGIHRSVFLIDKAGFIRWAKAGMPTTEEILAAIDSL